MSKEAIKVMKAKMSLQERQQLVKELDRDVVRFNYLVRGRSLGNMLAAGFPWEESLCGAAYWIDIFCRFTPEEIKLIIDINQI